MSTCADSNCGYYYKKEGEDYPRCHFDGFGKAPCEEDDWDAKPAEEDEDYEQVLALLPCGAGNHG